MTDHRESQVGNRVVVFNGRVAGVFWTGPAFAPRSTRSVRIQEDGGGEVHIVVDAWPGGEEAAQSMTGKRVRLSWPWSSEPLPAGERIDLQLLD